jgi:hypothetical protein
VEELVAGGEPLDFPASDVLNGFGVLVQAHEDPVGDRRRHLRGLRPDERRAPGVGDQAGVRQLRGLLQPAPGGDPPVQRGDGRVVLGRDLLRPARERAGVDVDGGGVEQLALGGLLALALIAFAQRRGSWLVVAGERLERVVGNALGKQRRGGAEQGVADLDVAVQERQRLAGLDRLQPQRHLGQLGGEFVNVDAVDAATDHLAQRLPHPLLGGLGVLGADGGEPPGDAAGGGDQEVPRPAGRVADGEGQQRRLPVLSLLGLVEQRVERRIQQAIDER